MNKVDIEQSITLPLRLKDYASSPRSRSIFLHIQDDTVTRWCLLLCMLEKGLISGITISNGQANVLRVVFNNAHKSGWGIVTWKGDFADLTITRNDIELLISFFLGYYRDGAADVDHLDFDMDPSRPGAKAATLTITVPRTRPPLSNNEVKQRLGLE